MCLPRHECCGKGVKFESGASWGREKACKVAAWVWDRGADLGRLWARQGISNHAPATTPWHCWKILEMRMHACVTCGTPGCFAGRMTLLGPSLRLGAPGPCLDEPHGHSLHAPCCKMLGQPNFDELWGNALGEQAAMQVGRQALSAHPSLALRYGSSPAPQNPSIGCSAHGSARPDARRRMLGARRC